MIYRIAQNYKYRGSDVWDWSAWIDATPGALRMVEYVTWVLHPTFTPARIDVRNRKNKFLLEASAWGTFRLRAQLHRNAADPIVVSCMLELAYPDENEAAGSSEARAAPSKDELADALSPYVFISYSSEDTAEASRARDAMTRLGVRVRDASEIKSGLPFDAAVRKMIRESVGVVSVLGSDYASPYVIAEMKLAEAEEKPAITLLPTGVTKPRELSPNVQAVQFSQSSDALEQQLAKFTHGLLSAKT